MQGEKIKLEDMDGKWERLEEEYKTLLVRGVTQLRKDLEALKRLTEGEVPYRRRLRSMSQVVAYLMGDASLLGLGLVMWSQRMVVLDAGEFTILYQGIS